MKKVLTVVVLCFFIFLGKAFSQEMSDNKANNLLNLQRNLEVERAEYQVNNELRGEEDIDELVSIADKAINSKKGITTLATWFSSDPEDLTPLRGTTWDFTYTIISTFTDTLSFDSTVQTTSDGYVGLSVIDQTESQGAVFYMDLPQGGRGFGAITKNILINQYYFFTITGNTATGYYGLEQVSTGLLSDLYRMTGRKISGPSITTTTIPNTTTTAINTINITNHIMTKDPKPDTGCETPTSVSNFSTQDVIAYCWLHYQNGTINSSIEWKFYGPDSSLYRTANYAIQYTNGCAWSGIYINNYPPANMPGNWHVDVYYNGIKQFTDYFTITDASHTTTSIQHTTSISPTTTTTSSTIDASLKADFYGSPTAGEAPLTVKFTNLSTGNIASYVWDFGDNSAISMEQNPTHIYQKAGTYSISLTVTENSGNKDIKVEKSYITVTSSGGCPFQTALKNTKFIDTLHTLRNKKFNNFYGKLLTSIFYRNAGEVNTILSVHPELQERLRELVAKNIIIAEDLILKGTAFLPQRNADEITAFLSEIAKDGSLRLKFYTALVINGIEHRFMVNGIGLNIN